MGNDDLIEKELSRSVIGALFEVYNNLGFGFLEHIYVLALERELLARGHDIACEVSVPVYYVERLGEQRIDMIVLIGLSLKPIDLSPSKKSSIRQLYNYLRGTDLEVGLLLHFGPKAVFLLTDHYNDQKAKGHGFDGLSGLGTESKKNLPFLIR